VRVGQSAGESADTLARGGCYAAGVGTASAEQPPIPRGPREVGAIIPWHDVAAIYEAGIPIERYGFSVRTRAINVRFHRARTLLRLPCSLWLTTLAMDTVKVSLFAAADPSATVQAQLEALRLAAVGHEDGAMPGSGGVPAARIVRE
jgi:hypothetical protein